MAKKDVIGKADLRVQVVYQNMLKMIREENPAIRHSEAEANFATRLTESVVQHAETLVEMDRIESELKQHQHHVDEMEYVRQSTIQQTQINLAKASAKLP